MTTQQLFFIFDKLEKHGVMSLIFTGGEPLVRKDFFEIYRYAYQKGFQIGILTNGVNLGLKKYQDFFSRYPPARVMISMNAISERTHEKVTGTRGNFARVLKGVSFLKKKKIPLGFQITLTQLNAHELDGIQAFSRKRRIPYIVTTNICDSLNQRRKKEIEALRLSPGIIKALSCRGKISHEVEEKRKLLKKKGNQFNCTLVERSFWVDPSGQTFLCAMHRDEPCQDIMKCDLDRLFEEHQKIVHEKQIRPEECLSCKFIERCDFACNAALRRAKKDTPEEFKYICSSVFSMQNT